MPSAVLVHAKLEMTTSGDSDEQEANEVAASIIKSGKIARSVRTGHSGSGVALPSQFGSQLASLQGQGSRLYGNLKSQMESGFGRDFSDVRIHTDGAAAEMADSISAQAFTYGNDIFFNRGQFNPRTSEGQRLVAHELTHVVQGHDKVGRKDEKKGSKEDAKWNRIIARISTYSTDFNHCHLEKGDLHPDLQYKVDYELAYSDWLVDYRRMVIRFNRISQDTIDEARENRGGVPVTVVVRASLKTDPDGAYLQTDTFDGIKTPMIILHEIESISKATQLLQDINDAIGPIQNLIITGHGKADSVAFTENHSLRVPSKIYSGASNKAEDINATKKFFQKVGKLMPEEEGKDKKIVFHSCLTASHFGLEANITDVAAKTVGWDNKRNVIGGNADLNEKIKFSTDNDGKLRVWDETSGMSRLSSDFVYYVGPGAHDPEGHIRGIVFKFYSNLEYAKKKAEEAKKGKPTHQRESKTWTDYVKDFLDSLPYTERDAVLALQKDIDYFYGHKIWAGVYTDEQGYAEDLFSDLKDYISIYLTGNQIGTLECIINTLNNMIIECDWKKLAVRIS